MSRRPAPTTLETERLVLAPPRAADADEIFLRYASDPGVTRYLAWPSHRTVDDTRVFIEFSAAEWARAGVGPYLIRARDDGRLIGSTGLDIDRSGDAMTGYVLARDEWHRGFATESLRAMVDLATPLGVPRIYAFCHPAHVTSQHVLAKCGFDRAPNLDRSIMLPNLDRRPQPVCGYIRQLLG